ncbi:uncharacterized protein [Choristoneura fumiferana]|uniref:uncharacterized protein n=1 Tax=Choristoneura fumiferana TaxID=7141 RepID=UPI003D15D106
MEGNNDGFVEEMLQEGGHMNSEAVEYKDISNLTDNLTVEVEKNITGETSDKHSAVWTTGATLTLLKLYESNIEMVETPKKKTRLWAAISENLKSYSIEMTPDQVRWKINALTKKYKQAVDSGQKRFKYFKEMNNIFGQCEDDDDCTISEQLQHKKHSRKNHLNLSMSESFGNKGSTFETKATIELRKIRLASRIEADRSQSKITLEKQWLEFLRRQEEHKQWRDEMFEKSLRLRQQELELRRKEVEIKEALELKRLRLKEKEHELLQIERDKCTLLSKIVEQKRLQNLH